MKQRTARAATKKFFNNTINKLRNRKKLQKDRLEAQHTALQLRITRFHTTQILNELGIADKTKRADIHKAVQEWKTAQMQTIYLTGGKKAFGNKTRGKYNKIISLFGDTRKFNLFITRLIELGEETATQVEQSNPKPQRNIFGNN